MLYLSVRGRDGCVRKKLWPVTDFIVNDLQAVLTMAGIDVRSNNRREIVEALLDNLGNTPYYAIDDGERLIMVATQYELSPVDAVLKNPRTGNLPSSRCADILEEYAKWIKSKYTSAGNAPVVQRIVIGDPVDVRPFKKKIEGLKAQLEGCEERYKSLDGYNAEDHMSRYNKLKKEHSELQRKFNMLAEESQFQSKANEKKVAQLQKNLDRCSKERTSALERVDKCGRREEDLRRQIEDREALARTKDGRMKQYQKDIERLEYDLGRTLDRKGTLEYQLKAAQDDVARLEENAAQNEDEVEELRERTDEMLAMELELQRFKEHSTVLQAEVEKATQLLEQVTSGGDEYEYDDE